jgi:hypothetical protein
MRYLNQDCLQRTSNAEFRDRRPYPWVALEDSLTPEGHEALRQSLPDVGGFNRMVGIKRAYGQAPHDRYLLHYRPSLNVSAPWAEFIAELKGAQYQSFLRRMLGAHNFILTFEWYYAWEGCAVSPHCDAARKIATHIFYFNTEQDWQPAWGGEILILDSGRRFRTHSAPSFDDLEVAAKLEPWGNESLFFQRTPHSWHGVRPLQCPPGNLRKLFIVTVNVPNFQVWWRQVRGKDPDGFRIRPEKAAAA